MIYLSICWYLDVGVAQKGDDERFDRLPRAIEALSQEREFFIDNLLVRIHLTIEMILVDRHCAMRV